MSDGNAPPGGYFIGRPANTDEPSEQPQPAAEAPPTVNEHLPGDYFVGRPANQQQEIKGPPPPQSFMAKWFSCIGGSKATS
ncbi:unnamed protein product [Alopecurus aequalis]